MRSTRPWQRQPGYRDLSFYGLRPGIAPLADELQLETTGKAGRQQRAQNTRQATDGERTRTYADLAAPGRFAKRIAANVGVQPAARAQVFGEIGAELQPVTFAIVAQIEVNAPHREPFITSGGVTVQPQQGAILDDHLLLRQIGRASG